jgi:hypothetical protein
MKHQQTPKEVIWKALLELEPRLAQMEEPDVPRLADKFLEELRISGFVLISVAELDKLRGAKRRGKRGLNPESTERSPKPAPNTNKKPAKRRRRPVDSEATT